MNRFTLSLFALAVGGVLSANADTSVLTEANGWQKITSISQSDIASHYYVFVDNASDLALHIAASSTQGNSALFYQATADPTTDLTEVFILEANGSNYMMRPLTVNNYVMQTEWSSSSNDLRWRTNDQAGAISWTGLGLAYADGAWTLTSTQYSRPLGIYNNGTGSPAAGNEVGANNAGNGQKFQIYAIERTAFIPSTFSSASDDNPVQTYYVINGAFDAPNSQIAAWQTTTDAQNKARSTNPNGDGITGASYENWKSSAFTGKLYQTINNIPNGKYRLSMGAMVNTVGDAGTQYVYANDDKTNVTEKYGTYTVETTVLSNSVEIGLGLDAATANWVAVDNAVLYYLGAITDFSAYVTSLSEAVAAGQAIVDQPMNATVKSALETAISTYSGKTASSYSTTEEWSAAIKAMQEATTNANTSIANYATAKTYLDAASGLDEAGQASYTANETVAAVQTAYDARTLEAVTSDQVTALEEAIRTAAKVQTTAGADMTLAIVNPSFEESGNNHTVGWTLTNHGNAANNGNFGLATGSYFVERWVSGGNTLSNGTMTQTITGLPVGKYTLSAEAQNLQQGDASVTPTGFYLTANDNKSDAISNTAGTFKVENVVVTDGSLTIGSQLDGCTGNWVCVDNFKLTFVGALTKEEALHLQISQLITTAQAITGDMSDAASTALSAAITAGNNSTSVTDTTSLNTVLTQLNAAIAKANTSVAANAAVASGTVSTSSIDGWTCTNSNTFHVNTWSSEGASDGSNMTTPFLENWHASGTALGEGQIYYTLEGLKAGTYYVSALARVLNEAGGEVTGASFFVNDATDAITTDNHASTCTNGIYKNVVLAATVEDDGTLKFGFDLASPSFNWISFKDVKIGELGSVTLDETSTTAPETTTGYVKATLARNFAAGWNSLVLPFATTTDELGADEAASYAGTSNDSIKFTKTTELKANTPYLVHFAEGSVPTSLTFDVVKIAPADTITVEDANGQFNFVGTYAAIAQGDATIAEGDYIVVAAGIKRAAGGNALKAFRAYFDAQTADAAAKKMTLSIDGDVVTAIDGVSVNGLADDNAPAYNLAGQRVGKSYKGVVVKNGKKLIRK